MSACLGVDETIVDGAIAQHQRLGLFDAQPRPPLDESGITSLVVVAQFTNLACGFTT
jgi:hypothetical protein